MQRSAVFTSTLKFDSWGDRVRTLDRPYRGPARHRLRGEVVRLWRVLKAARTERMLLLDSVSGRLHPDLIACALLALLPKSRRPILVLQGDMWAPRPGARGLFERALIDLVDRAVDRYIVYSSDDRDVFPGLWGINPDKVGVCLCYHHVTDEELAGEEPANEGHVFAGGDSGRDYAPLVEAARQFPETQFVIATAWTSPKPVPPNVKLVLAERTPTSHAEFIRLLRTSRAVVVPIKRGMRLSVGQQTILNSMFIGKPTIVSDSLGVREHVNHGDDALIVEGSTESYAAALSWVLNPQNRDAVAHMAARGRERAKVFNRERIAECLFAQVTALMPTPPTDSASDLIPVSSTAGAKGT
jgi:glycosyltransferase involved in cell wall biosynthesis